MHGAATSSNDTRDTLIAELQKTVAEQAEQIAQLHAQLLWLKRQQFGRKSEQLSADQLSLLAADDIANAAEPDTETVSYTRAKGGQRPVGRSPLPDSLPRVECLHDLSDAERASACPDGQLERIGEEVVERLEYEPGRLYVERHVTPKYACIQPDGERAVVTATSPTAPLPGAQVGPGLLAQVLVAKFADHLPLNRLEGIFARHGYRIARQTLCDWVLAVGELLEPLSKRLQDDVLASPIIHTDDSVLPEQVKGRGQVRKSRLWVYIGRGGDHLPVVFDYTPTRSRDGPKALLAGYAGFLQADAYPGYDSLFDSGAIVEVGCWAHARRYFEKAAQQTKKAGRAHRVLSTVAKLYRLEREWVELDAEARREQRTTHAAPILDELHGYLVTAQAAVPPRGTLGTAISYTLGNWTALTRYLDDGRLAPDNNLAENAIRGLALGRKNWLFAGSARGAKALAVLLSLVETCKRADVNGFDYFKDVLGRIQDHPVNQLDRLLPYRWQPSDN